MATNPALTIYQSSAERIINTAFTIEKLTADCAFTEGPVWHHDGYYLFSDIPENVIYKLIPGSDKEVYIDNSGLTGAPNANLSDQPGSNGLAFDTDGSLLICQHGNGAVAKWNGNELRPFINSFSGKPFNSPNDIIVHDSGLVFFSDPPYGLKDQTLQPDKRQPIAGVYCKKGDGLHLVCDRYNYPNGVCLSPNGKYLYISSSKPAEKFISRYDVEHLTFSGIVAEENCDGLKCDDNGNLFLCTKEGIIIIDNSGNRLAAITLETIPANACWGGAERKDFFITARQNIFLIRNLLKK